MKSGIKVIVIKEECVLKKKKRIKDKMESKIYYTILDSCVKCNICIEKLGCPAIEINNKKGTILYRIDQSRCVSHICLGVCKQVCKNYVIKKSIILKKKSGKITYLK